MAYDFTHAIESPQTDDKLPVYTTLTDLQQLFSYLERDQSRFLMWNELMFKLLATTGLRCSELVSITWQQVHIVNETIRIDGKGKKNGSCPISLSPHLTPAKYSIKEYESSCPCTLKASYKFAFYGK